MFQINEVVEFENELYRILALLLEEVVWIPVTKAGIFPSIVPTETLVNAVENGMLVRKPDPYAYLIYEMPAKGSVQQQKLEKNLQLIQPIICDADCFLPKVRSAKIAQVMAEHSTTKQTLYRLLMCYWQRGQTANALLPDYKNSGGRGKTRQAKDKKLGRPRVHAPGKGAIVDEATRRLFRIAIEKHLLTNKENGLKSAHNHFKGIYETFYLWQPLEFFLAMQTRWDATRRKSAKCPAGSNVPGMPARFLPCAPARSGRSAPTPY